jgi:hypothetical protein
MPPPILARRNFFHFFYFWSQFQSFYLSNTRFSGSLARLRACCARIFPLVAAGVGLRRDGMYQPPLTVGGGKASCSMRSRIAANNFRVVATSASWNVTYFACLVTFAPIFMSFSLSVVSDQCFTSTSGSNSVKLSCGGVHTNAVKHFPKPQYSG